MNEKHLNLLFDKLRKTAFPEDLVGKDINDICMTTLDDSIAGLISGFDGKLSGQRREILSSCINDLDQVLPQLSGNSHDYFQLLKNIAVEIMTRSN